MAKERYELAKVDYDNGMKYKDIAAKYDVTINTVKSWKTRKWNQNDGTTQVQPKRKGVHTNKKGVHTNKDAYTEIDETADNEEIACESGAVEDIFDVDMMGLNERQFLFCLEYLKRFNATKSYMKVYECSYASAAVNGHKLLKNAKIQATIKKFKRQRAESVMLSKDDILQKYMDIAFADVTDYLKFGRVEEIVYNEDGEPELDINSQVKTYMRTYVHLNNSEEVDGTLITEVKQGKDGVVVKLADKMKALQVLAEYKELLKPRDAERLRIELMNADLKRKEVENEVAHRELEKAKMNDQTASVNNPLTGIETDELKRYLNAFEGG